jgi:peroxiredoxin
MDSGDGRALSVGDLAPDFHLPANIGREIALGDYRGNKHVVLFFVRAFQ